MALMRWEDVDEIWSRGARPRLGQRSALCGADSRTAAIPGPRCLLLGVSGIVGARGGMRLGGTGGGGSELGSFFMVLLSLRGAGGPDGFA